MQSVAPEVSIIIVNWNGIGVLPACLRSIAQNPPNEPFEVIVVDNASSDGSLEWLRSGEPSEILGENRFVLIESGQNLGFGKGVNLGIKNSSTPFIFLLNPDTVVATRAIDKLVEALISEPGIGLVGPRILNEDGSLQISVWSHPPTPLKILFEGLHLYLLLPRSVRAKWLWSRHWDHNERRIVPSLSGAAMMLRRDMIDEIGAFSPEFHMYGEDSELCARISDSRWKFFFEPASIVTHLGGKSSEQRWQPLEFSAMLERTYIAYQLKTLPRTRVFMNVGARLVVETAQICKQLGFGRDTQALRTLWVLNLRALGDLIRNRKASHFLLQEDEEPSNT